MRRCVLVVAKDVGLRAAMARWLAPAGFAIELAESAKRAYEVLATAEVAAGILRLETPDATILPVATKLRQAGGRLMILIDELENLGRLARLGLDADACLREPLTQCAVVEQLNAILEPANEREDSVDRAEIINFDGMTLDLSGHSLVDARGREVKLTRAEFSLLAALARRPGQTLSRDRLLDAVSGRHAETFDRSIDNLIVRLRRKIERDAKKPRLIITVPGTGYKFLSRSPPPHPVAAPRFSIFVLPFANLGGGPDFSHFASGVTTMLTAELKHVIGATVLGCDAGVNAWADGATAQEIGWRLGARYVVRGSVRRRGDEVRVNSQVTDAPTGIQIWAGCIDGRVGDLFAFEKEVTASIARAIDLELVEVESGREQSGTSQPVALATRGHSYLNRPRSAENLCRARDLFEAALRHDDRCSEAVVGLAHTHIADVLNRWNADPVAKVRLADTLAARAIELSTRSAYAYFVRGLVLRTQQRHEQALAAFDTAAQINPSLAPAHAEIGFVRDILSCGESARAHSYDGVAFARRISPRDPVLANWLYGLGAAHVQSGEYEQGMALLNESIGLNPLPPALAYLAAVHALIGDEEQARSVLSDFRRQFPAETLRSFTGRIFAGRRIFAHSRVYQGLRKAGLPQR